MRSHLCFLEIFLKLFLFYFLQAHQCVALKKGEGCKWQCFNKSHKSHLPPEAVSDVRGAAECARRQVETHGGTTRQLFLLIGSITRDRYRQKRWNGCALGQLSLLWPATAASSAVCIPAAATKTCRVSRSRQRPLRRRARASLRGEKQVPRGGGSSSSYRTHMALVTTICSAVMDGKPKTCAMLKEGEGAAAAAG